MINQDWSYYYNILHDYYSNLEIEGFITEYEMEDCLEVIHDSSLGQLTEECATLGLVNIPFILPNS